MSKFSSKFAGFLLKVFFWDDEDLHEFYREPKAVVIVAPHTSIFDFVLGKLVTVKYQVPSAFFIKKEAFSWPIVGNRLRKWGGIPIDRGNYHNTHVQDAVDCLNNSQNLWVIITPEGTRHKVNKWKTGFYKIALQANVPILISYIDYKKHIGTIIAKLYPSGDYEADLAKIMPYYDGVTPFHRHWK